MTFITSLTPPLYQSAICLPTFMVTKKPKNRTARTMPARCQRGDWTSLGRNSLFTIRMWIPETTTSPEDA